MCKETKSVGICLKYISNYINFIMFSKGSFCFGNESANIIFMYLILTVCISLQSHKYLYLIFIINFRYMFGKDYLFQVWFAKKFISYFILDEIGRNLFYCKIIRNSLLVSREPKILPLNLIFLWFKLSTFPCKYVFILAKKFFIKTWKISPLHVNKIFRVVSWLLRRRLLIVENRRQKRCQKLATARHLAEGCVSQGPGIIFLCKHSIEYLLFL